MTDASELLRLAGLCEAASGEDRELDKRIAFHVGHRPWDVRTPRYTASLDVALTLAPETWRVGGLDQHDHEILRAKGDWTAWLYPDGKLEPVTGDKPRCRFAATAPLALCAASLRAIALTQGQNT